MTLESDVDELASLLHP